MKIAVSYDVHGRILTLFHPEAVQAGTKGTLRYLPAPGERHHVLEVPAGFEKKSVLELAEALRVNTTEAHPKLEPIAK